MDGQTIDNAHYVELVGAPRGPFPIQRINEDMIREAAGEYIPIDAKMFRAGVRQKDELCYDLLHPSVARYVEEQYELADRNNRLVGADPSHDRFSLQDLRSERSGVMPKPDAPTQRRDSSIPPPPG